MNNIIQASMSRDTVTNIKPINIGHVYAVRFSDGWVKVGRGRKPDQRIVTHQSASRMRGAVMTESYVSGLLSDCKSAEKRLIDICARSGTLVHGNEWFCEVDLGLIKSEIDHGFDLATEQTHVVSRERQEVVATKILAAISGPREPLKSPEAVTHGNSWSSALVHAATIERLLLDDLFGGELFADTGNGLSFFFISAALAFYKMSPADTAGLYVDAMNSPEECINIIQALAMQVSAEHKGAA